MVTSRIYISVFIYTLLYILIMEQDRYKKVLNQNLKEIRKNKGLTAVDVAQILGVSQAKISYIENDKGVLSARDVAVLSKKLNIPVTEFYRGLDKIEPYSEIKETMGNLAHFGATLLAKPSFVPLKPVPFEEVFATSLAYIEDDRLNKAFHAALISHASSQELNIDRIFAIIGNNPFLLKKAAEQARLSLETIQLLNKKKETIRPRGKKQIEKIISVATELTGKQETRKSHSPEELRDLADFVGDCLKAKR